MHFLRLTNCRALKAASVRHNKQTLFLWDARLRLAIIPYQGSFYLPLSYLVGTYIYLWESILECFQCQRIAVKTMYLNKELSKWEKNRQKKKSWWKKKKGKLLRRPLIYSLTILSTFYFFFACFPILEGPFLRQYQENILPSGFFLSFHFV